MRISDWSSDVCSSDLAFHPSLYNPILINTEQNLSTPSKITCVEDFRQLAERRVPRMFYDYADSGSWTESTYRANETDFQKIKFRQRVAVDISHRSLRSSMLGLYVAIPVAISPTVPPVMHHPAAHHLRPQAPARLG